MSQQTLIRKGESQCIPLAETFTFRDEEGTSLSDDPFPKWFAEHDEG